MSFNVSSINPFVNETAEQLIKRALITGNTMDEITLQAGIKYKEKINILDNTITVADATCAWTSQGSVAFLQREIEVHSLEIKETLCQTDLEPYWMGQSFAPGAPYENQIGAILADSYIEKIAEFNELNIWKGNTGTASTYGKIDGFQYILSNEPTRITGTATTAFTSANVIDVIDAMVSAIPEDIADKNNLVLNCSYAFYRMAVLAYTKANLYQMNIGPDAVFAMNIPNTNVMLKARKGLTGTNHLILTYMTNLIVGVDLANEYDKLDIFYDRGVDALKVLAKWKIGCQVAFPQHVVCNF
jgi:hypothetical protein